MYKKTFWITLTLLFMSYVWITVSLLTDTTNSKPLCLLKRISGVPCPSCGTTRSILSILHGHFKEAFYLNPLGYLAVIILLTAPIVLVVGLIKKRNYLYEVFSFINSTKWTYKVWIPALTVLIINWIWNILKHM